MDRSGDVNEQTREVEAIEHLAEQLRGEGTSEATITKEIAQQTAGGEADLERGTQAQADTSATSTGFSTSNDRSSSSEPFDRDKAQLQEASAPETDRECQPQQTTELEPDEPYIEQVPTVDPEPHAEQPEKATSDPYIEQAIQEARERQESWERGIDPDRDNDRGFGIE